MNTLYSQVPPHLPIAPSSQRRSALWLCCLGVLAQMVVAQAVNLPPTISFLQPSNGAVLVNPTEIQILAQASDADGFVRTVEVFTDLGSLGSVTPNPAVASPKNPWQWTWSNPPAGDHKLVAQATDNDGAVSYSESLVITVQRDVSPSGATLVIVKPVEGETFTSNAAVISIELTAIDPLADIRHVEFFANDLSIGRSDQWTKDAVFPGKPREHFLDWKPLEGGTYALTAQAADSQGNLVVSKPVNITVGPQLPVVSIEATVPETAEPGPTIRIRPGVFTIKRSGPTTNALTIFLAYDGSATPILDYQALPESVTIPAGATSTDLLVAPVEDSLEEGIETVGARLIDPPFDRLPDQFIDPQANAAKVIIHDSGFATTASLEITSPTDGAGFKAGQPITINATAIDWSGSIARVEFYDSEILIGVSELAFFRAPDPGTPIYHSLEWQNPSSGEHVLSARAVDATGNPIVSKPVSIKVEGPAGGSAVLQITDPKDGEEFTPGQTITVAATAIDPNGYIATVEFFDDQTKIGASQLAFFRAPDPGTPIYHTFQWVNAAPGKHLLSARAIDSNGNRIVSTPVVIVVATANVLPTVHVSAIDAQATELSPLVDAIDPARFLISRDGDLSQDLYVVFSLHGTAQPDQDYKRPEGFVRIPAGQSDVTIDIVPLADGLTEPMETVALRLEDPTPISALPVPPTPYAMPESTRVAVAVIYDQRPPENGAIQLALPSEGEVYSASQPLVLMAAAFHPTSDLNHVDFYAGGKLVGSSDVLDGKVPSGGLVVHRFDWKEPLVGDQVITAHALRPDGTEWISDPVHITIKGLDLVPAVSVLQPQSGAVFSLGAPVEMIAAAMDPSRSIQRLDLLVDDQLVASVTDSKLSTNRTDLAAGPHLIVARITDSQGTQFDSIPVKILVWDAAELGGSGAADMAEVTQIARHSNGTVRLQLSGPINGLGLLEVSSDLVNWQAVPPVYLPDGQIIIEEDVKTGPTCRFYRTRSK